MSQENVERFHRVFRQWYEREQIGPDLLAEDVEWVNPQDAVERGTRRGIRSFNQAIARVADAWVGLRFETERVIDCGEDVVASFRFVSVGRDGIETVAHFAQISTLRAGRITHIKVFLTKAEARAAAGLSE